jgi:hypothetical protein
MHALQGLQLGSRLVSHHYKIALHAGVPDDTEIGEGERILATAIVERFATGPMANSNHWSQDQPSRWL